MKCFEVVGLIVGLSLISMSPNSLGAMPATQVVDASTMSGKVMCGYQGWFNAPHDGSDRNWIHWGWKTLSDGQWTVDMLPDVRELDPDERYDTGLRNATGTPIQVFSSYNPKTIARHFKWMQDYGIDGVFLQRFANGISDPSTLSHYDQIVSNVRAGAQTYGRAWGMMYDLSGLKAGDAQRIINDWKKLDGTDRITHDKQYIHQNGKPIVVLWGIGFGDGTAKSRPDLFTECIQLCNFLKNDPTYGGNTVMIGVPHRWGQMLKKGDARAVAFKKALLAADIIQPWAVGSCETPSDVVKNAADKWTPDLAWCRQHAKQYMPVVFPGFTWHNLQSIHHTDAKSDQVPRLGGTFLWKQYVEAKKVGASMVYQAMFDEVDEGTAIFKMTDDLPTPGKSVFVGTHGLPSDFYLKLVGEATRLIHGDIRPDQEKLIGHP